MRKEKSKHRMNLLARFEPLLVSHVRCHLLGSVLSLILVIGIAWIWKNADAFATDDRYSPQQIEQATQLVADAENLRNQNADIMLASNQIDRRLEAIRAWLPQSIQWQPTRQRIEETAEQAELEMMFVDKGETRTGQRVGIQQVTCEVQGSYLGICQFLHELSSDPKPIWCDSVTIRRVPADLGKPVECAATVSLRLPFVAGNTIAGKLMPPEVPDAK